MRIEDGLTKQDRWKKRQGDAWKKHRAAYMRQYRKTGNLLGLASKAAKEAK
jgi:hypothetical protein